MLFLIHSPSLFLSRLPHSFPTTYDSPVHLRQISENGALQSRWGIHFLLSSTRPGSWPAHARIESDGCCHPCGSLAPLRLPPIVIEEVVECNVMYCMILDFHESGKQTVSCTNLEAGGDGSKLIVCCFSISYQVVPAGEHFPAEIEAVIIADPWFICITCHPLI